MTDIYDIQVEHGWGDDDAPPNVSGVEWLRTPRAAVQEVTVLSPDPARYWGHWDQRGKRFRKCHAPKPCRDCFSASGRQKRFVLAVLDAEGTPWAWEFGEYQRDMIKDLLAASGAPLRGLSLVLRRPDAGGNPPIIVLPGEPCPDVGALPEAPDVDALLWGTWVRQALKRGKEHPRPGPGGRAAGDPDRGQGDPDRGVSDVRRRAADSRPAPPTAPAVPEPDASSTPNRSAPEGPPARLARLLRKPDATDRRYFEMFGRWPPDVRPQPAPEVPPDDSS